MSDTDPPFVPARAHARRLREVYRSAGWPCQDLVEVELLAAGLLQRVTATSGHETLRVTDAGIRLIAATLQVNRAARSAHEALVDTVAREMTRAGRLAWTGLTLRAWVAEPGTPAPSGPEPAPADPGATADDPLRPPAPPPSRPGQWVLAMPDVFSIRRTTVEAYLHPVVHEIKVRRADLLGDLKKPAKRAAYLDMGGECWYVLGADARGRPVGSPDDIPPECGVMLATGGVLTVARPAPRRPIERLPLAVWMELAQRTPCRFDDGEQAPLSPVAGPDGPQADGG